MSDDVNLHNKGSVKKQNSSLVFCQKILQSACISHLSVAIIL